MLDRRPGTRDRTASRCKVGAVAAFAASVLLSACSMNDVVADALTSDGGSAFVSDSDPKLIREALPFGLKMYESLLAKSPDHKGLLLACARGFTAYAYLVQTEADMLNDNNIDLARAERARASKLFLRGRDYALRGLEGAHKGFADQLEHDTKGALAKTDKDDIGFLYWAGLSWAGAINADKDNLEVLANLPKAGALVGRVLQLDETYENGGAHEFFISYEAGRPGGSLKKALYHYRRALALSKGKRAATYIALAEAVAIKRQNLKEFRDLIKKARAVNVDAAPELRLVNAIAQERADWLEKRIPDLFVAADSGGRS